MTWLPEPTILVSLVLLQIGYQLVTGPWRARFAAATGVRTAPVSRRQRACFSGSVIALALALVTPLDTLADTYLLSAHMVQHLLLTIVAPPLLLLGTPGWLVRPALRWPRVAAVARVLTRARLAFAIGNVTVIVWHIPVFYDAALRIPAVHALEHATFIVVSVILWWPVLSPLRELPPLTPPLQMLYVFLQTLPGALLGIILGMAPVPLYPTYTEAPVRLLGLSPLADQQVAGLIMWVGTNLFWLAVLTTVFFVWAAREQADGLETPALSGPPASDRSPRGIDPLPR